MIAFKDYAKAHNTSYETVRRTVTKHEDVFKDHIIEVNRVRYLDEEGERLLDEMRGTTPQVIRNQEKRDEKESLEQLTIRLQNKVIELEERLHAERDKYTDLQTKYIALLEAPEAVPEEATTDAPEDQPQEEAQNTVQDAPERPKMTFGQRFKFLFTGK